MSRPGRWSSALGLRRLDFTSGICLRLPGCQWTRHSASLCLSFPSCKTRRRILASLVEHFENWWWKVLDAIIGYITMDLTSDLLVSVRGCSSFYFLILSSWSSTLGLLNFNIFFPCITWPFPALFSFHPSSAASMGETRYPPPRNPSQDRGHRFAGLRTKTGLCPKELTVKNRHGRHVVVD